MSPQLPHNFHSDIMVALKTKLDKLKNPELANAIIQLLNVELKKVDDKQLLTQTTFNQMIKSLQKSSTVKDLLDFFFLETLQGDQKKAALHDRAHLSALREAEWELEEEDEYEMRFEEEQDEELLELLKDPHQPSYPLFSLGKIPKTNETDKKSGEDKTAKNENEQEAEKEAKGTKKEALSPLKKRPSPYR